MHRRLRTLLPLFVALGLTAATVFAAPRDNAANKKIDEAINQHYLATDFDKAEAVLTGTIKACDTQCSPAVIAKAWMYVGIVRGSGKQDQKGAKEAFESAIKADPKVQLDAALATPETKTTFDSVGGGGAGTGGTDGGGGSGGGAAPPPDAVGEMTCSPSVREVQTRRIIPFSCTTEENAVAAELRYKPYGGDDWKTVKMAKKGEAFQGEIPCAATSTAGKLRIYIRAKDAAGDVVDTYGSKSKPVEIDLVGDTEEDAPAYPDQDAPERCAEAIDCPPGMEGMPGCKKDEVRGNVGWGGSCESSNQCQSGLVCIDGSCETAQSCDTNADCKSGKCVDGTCKEGDGPSGPYKKNWLGIHVAQDLAIMGGNDVCSPDSQANDGFACFAAGTETRYEGFTSNGLGGNIQTGFAPATTRLMVSFDRAFTPNIMAGLRAGYAFGGGPAAGDAKFLPFHGELRLSYWLGGKDILARKGVRPYVHIGGGVAQVDAKKEVTVVDCTLPGGQPDQACIDTQSGTTATPLKLDAYKKLGQSFATLGGGVVYAVSPNSGFQLNINFMAMFPTSGVVIQPSLGYIFGI